MSMSIEQRKKASERARVAHKKGRLPNPPSQLGNKFSAETRLKMSKAQRKRVKEGRSHLWKGGISSLNQNLRNSFEMRLWREAVFARDNWTCLWCGIRSAKGVKVILHADHIKPFALFPELRFAIDNGRTLCKQCHSKTPSYLNRWFKE